MKEERVAGVAKRHPEGFGFLIPDQSDQPDLFLSRKEMTGVMTNDRVTAQIQKEKRGKRFFGVDLEIIQRGVTHVVGQIHKHENGDFQIYDGFQKWGAILKIPFKKSSDAKEGDLVAVKILKHPSKKSNFTGQVVEIIGDNQDPNTDLKRVLHGHHIPMDFPLEVMNEVHHIPQKVDIKEHKDRKDLRELAFITIDGTTAKDFDDAIHVQQTKKGFCLWVAIADVSYYVRQGSGIDDEAFKRGTSVYLPNFVVPMLPEELSNGICSLKPNLDRLAFVCEMEIGFDGSVSKVHIHEAVICSQARITYGEAQEIIDGHEVHKKEAVQENILQASQLAKILMNKRHKEGSLDLEIPETEVLVNELGQTVDVIKSERVFAHKLIEEMMLIANVSVAKMIQKKKQPSLFRVHSPPDPENIDRLQLFLSQFGSHKKLRGGHLQKKLTECLQDFKSKPQGIVLSILTLRSMNQAVYDKNNIGHFGLGFSHYTHFTSPIRRYPDLIIHRILKKLFTSSPSGLLYSEEDLGSFGSVLSGTEQRAVKAERQVVSIKKARFLENKIGKSFSGIVSGVTRFGVFVLLRQFDIDGLVKLEFLGNEFFEFHEENLMLTGQKTGKIYKLGDPVNIIVAAVDTVDGKIDFLLTKKDGTPLFEKNLKNTYKKSKRKDRGKPRRKNGEKKAFSTKTKKRNQHG